MSVIIALLLIGAQADTPAAPQAVAAADEDWNRCIQDGLDRSDREASPRAIARQIASDCDAAAQRMVAERSRWIEGSPLGEREKRRAIRGIEDRVTSMTRMIEMMVRASRDD